MLTKAQIKHLQDLKLKKYRQNYDEFVLEGDKLTTEALLGNADLRLIVATNDWIQTNSQRLPTNISVEVASERDLQKISSLVTAPPVIALVGKMKDTLETISTKGKWIIALDGINDPGNLGTIIRTADWFGIDTIICSNDCVDCYNPKVVQSTMGSLFRVKVVYTDLLDFLSENGQNAYAAVLSGENLNHLTFNPEGVLVIGSESHGISDAVLQKCSGKITIPQYGKAESLNAGVATGIILSAIRRVTP